jgi:chaperonin GroEL
MSAGKIILKDKKCRDGILNGIIETASVVSSTYGPRGKTVAYEKGGSFKITKDGLSVAKEIKFSNEQKNFAASLIKEAASYANFSNGDGSTNVTILTAELCREVNNLLNQGIDINDIRDGFKRGRDFVLSELSKFKKEIQSEKDFFNIAKISANNDEEIAKYITEAFNGIGDNGIVSIGTSQSRQGITSVIFTTGFEFDRGFISSKCVNSTNDQCILNDPKILLSLKPLNEVENLKPIVTYCEKNRLPLIIIAPNFDEEVMAFFNEILARKVIQGSLILSPGTDKISIENKLNDLAISINAKILGQDVDFSTFDVEKDFGLCKKIIIQKSKTTIIDCICDQDKFDNYIKLLEARTVLDSAEKAYSEYEIESIKERIARMTGGIATILVGALTEIELSEKRDRYEDAVNAVRNTIKDGYIPGASIPLLRISYLDSAKYSLDSQHPGQWFSLKAYLKALRKPSKLLISSTGDDPENIIPEILKENNNFGYDAKQAKIVDLLEAGIIDPYKIIYNNILYATNIAEQFLSINSIIISDVQNMDIKPLDEILNEDGIKF